MQTSDEVSESNRPQREELRGLDWSKLIARFGVGVENFDRRVLELDDAALDTAFRAESNVGRWPARVLLGHLADAEVLFTERMRKIVAEDAPILPNWDEHAFIDSGVYGTPDTGSSYPIGAFIATVHTLRAWMSEWLATVDDAQQQRRGMHPLRGEMSLRDVLEYDVWHLEHHAWFLARKIEVLMPGGCGAGASES